LFLSANRRTVGKQLLSLSLLLLLLLCCVLYLLRARIEYSCGALLELVAAHHRGVAEPLPAFESRKQSNLFMQIMHDACWLMVPSVFMFSLSRQTNQQKCSPNSAEQPPNHGLTRDRAEICISNGKHRSFRGAKVPPLSLTKFLRIQLEPMSVI
jgi:hypothetical protein